MTGVQSRPHVRFEPSPGFAPWLRARGVSLAVSTYDSGKLLLVGTQPDGRLSIFDRTIPKPMGIAAHGTSLWVAARGRLLRFEAASAKGPYDRHYLPRVKWYTGDIDAHDVVVDDRGPVVVATAFDALVRPSMTRSFDTEWMAPGLDRPLIGDRCHLNGVGTRDGRLYAATLAGRSLEIEGWRSKQTKGGELWLIAENRKLADGFFMPHSPRWHEGSIYLHDSGRGRIVRYTEGRVQTVAELPGFGRGLAILDGHAIVGLSRPRERPGAPSLPLAARLRTRGGRPMCGVAILDLASGRVVHHLEIHGTLIRELYDVAVLEGTVRPSMTGFRDEERFQIVSLAGSGAGQG